VEKKNRRRGSGVKREKGKNTEKKLKVTGVKKERIRTAVRAWGKGKNKQRRKKKKK